MIKSIKVEGIHWVTEELKFWQQTKIVWMSKLGKTTILNTIMACYSGYFPGYWTGLPLGSATLTTDKFEVEMSGKRIVWMPQLPEDKAELIRYIVPGNFFKLTKSTWDQRMLITKALEIDTTKLEDANENLKRLKAEEKDFDSKKDQITDDAIRLEESLEELNLEKPKEVKAIPDNSADIINAYKALENKVAADNIAIRWRNQIAAEDYETQVKNAELTNYAEIKEGKAEIDKLSNSLLNIKAEADRLKWATNYICSECNQEVKVDNTDKQLQKLREDYKIESDMISEYKSNLIDLEAERNRIVAQVKEPNYEWLYQVWVAHTLEDKARVWWVKYTAGNTAEYNIYTTALRDYDMEQARKQTIQSEIDLKDKQIKELSSANISKDIKKYTKIKTEFNKMVELKVKETWLDIRLFKTLQNGNIRETFDIFDSEWNSYWATSSGNELYMELLIAKLFVRYLDLDFILMDKFESVWVNLREEIYKECKWYQLIVTEVTEDKTIKAVKI